MQIRFKVKKMQGQELKAAKKQLDGIPDPEQIGRRHVVM